MSFTESKFWNACFSQRFSSAAELINNYIFVFGILPLGLVTELYQEKTQQEVKQEVK